MHISGSYFRSTLKLLIFSVLLSVSGFSQNQTSKWHFGSSAGIDFMTSPPTPIVGSMLVTAEGSSGISDAAGNLLFYTDGITVWNSTNAVMTGGTGLLGDPSSTQSAVVVKQPGNNNIYYVFTMACCNMAAGLNYTTIDMTLSGGLGAVTSLNVPLAGNSSERLTSVKHCNGIDTWVLSQDGVTGDFRAHLVTSAGVSAVPVISSIGSNVATGGASVGYMKFSPNGRKLGLAAANDPTVGFELYDFDATTGILSNRLFLLQNSWAYGCEFSPDGTKFYGALWGGPTLYQWDLCAGTSTAIVASQYTTATNGGGALQLAMDGKIYMIRSGMNVMGEIANPNALGAGSAYTDLGLSIAPNTNQWGLPNFITSGLKQAPPPFTYSTVLCAASFSAPPIYQNYTVNACAASGYSLTGISWNFGDPASGANNTSTLTNPTHYYNSPGTYSASLILNFSCGGGTDTIKQNVVINQACLNVVSVGVSCASPGSATVTAVSGVGPFIYFWLPSGPTNSVLSNVFPGTYSVMVFDVGSSTSFTSPVTITSNGVYTSTLSNSASVPCFGASTGTAAIQVSGGSGTQNYYWYNGSTTVTTPTLNNLPAGPYTVTVIDAISSCSVTNTFNITQPSSQTVSIASSTLIACVGSDITFTASSSGGTPGYNYSWSTGTQNVRDTVNMPIGGNYVYTVISTDANNCSASASVQVTFINIPVPTITQNFTAICSGETLLLSAAGGTAFAWTDPTNATSNQQNLTIPNVANANGGVYTMTTSVGSCSAATSQTIVINPLPNPIISAPTICEEHPLQLANIPGGAITFTWTGPNFSSNNQSPLIPLVFANTHGGTYTMTGTDANNCRRTVTLAVTILSNPPLQAGGSTVCFGSPLTLSGSGAATYTWSGPNNFSSNLPNPTIPAATSATQTVYSVTASAVNGCTATMNAMVNTIPLPVPDLTITPRTCLNGSVSLEGIGGATYKWTGPYNFSATTQSVVFHAVNMRYAGIYTLTAMNVLGCPGTKTGVLQIDPLPQGALNNNIQNVCIPFCADFSLNKITPAPLTNLTWEIKSTTYTTPSFSYCFGTTGMTMIKAMMTDDLGCANTMTFGINAYTQPLANFEYSPPKPIEAQDFVNFVNTSTGDDITAWSWHFADNTDHKSTDENTSYRFENAGVYPVAMVVKNKWGCMDTIVKAITVDSDFGLFVPNAFTPNNDSNNEVFMAKGIGVGKYNLVVYNRWGQKMFETNDFGKGWDGTFKGQECKADVYIWKITAFNLQGKEILKNGLVTLYR